MRGSTCLRTRAMYGLNKPSMRAIGPIARPRSGYAVLGNRGQGGNWFVYLNLDVQWATFGPPERNRYKWDAEEYSCASTASTYHSQVISPSELPMSSVLASSTGHEGKQVVCLTTEFIHWPFFRCHLHWTLARLVSDLEYGTHRQRS
jgi:hypothetical protein